MKLQSRKYSQKLSSKPSQTPLKNDIHKSILFRKPSHSLLSCYNLPSRKLKLIPTCKSKPDLRDKPDEVDSQRKDQADGRGLKEFLR